MKKIILLIVLVLTIKQMPLQATMVKPESQQAHPSNQIMLNLTPQEKMFMMNQMLKLSPKQFEQTTGVKLGFFGKVKYKLAQHFIKAKQKIGSGEKMSRTLYVILSLLFLGWLAIGLQDDWRGANWIIDLLLYIIMWLPGFVFAILKMNEYTSPSETRGKLAKK